MDASDQATLVDHVKHRLRFHEWCGRNRLGQSLFVCNSAIESSDLPNWTLHRQRRIEPVWAATDIHPAILAARSVERDSTPDVPPPATRTIWTRVEQPDVVVRIDLLECASRDDAHERVVRMVADFESPLVSEAEGPLGDVAFSGGGGGLILFARANLIYLLRNVGRLAVSVEPMALSLDAAAIPVPDRGVAMSALHAPAAPASESDDPTMELTLQDGPADRAQGCWKYMSPVGDFLMRERRVFYRGPSSGLRQITIYK